MKTKLIPIALVLLLASSAVAVPTEIEDSITAVITNEGPAGVNQLQGEWVSKQEIHQVYLRDSGALTYGTCSGNGCPNAHRLLYSDLDAAGLLGAGPATFSYGTTAMDTPIYQMDALLNIAATGGATITVELTADGVAIPGSAASFTTSDIGTLPSFQDPVLGLGFMQASPYQLSAPYTEPIIVPGGVDFGIRVTSGAPLVPGEVYLSLERSWDLEVGVSTLATSEQSWMRFRAESAHIQTWTENIDGTVQDLFPTPSSAPTTDRTMRVAVAQVNSLGQKGLDRAPHTLAVTGVATGNLYFERGGNSDGISPWGYPNAAPGDLTASSDGVFFTYYQLTYDDDQAEIGDFRVTVSSANGGWSTSDVFAIGGGLFDINLLQTEDQIKEILLGSSTNFRFEVTNLGSVVDDGLITFVGDQTNWDVSVDPGTFLSNMAAGESRVVTVTVTPPASAIDEDQFNLTVGAQSVVSQEVTAQLVRVIMTDEPTYGLTLLGNFDDVKLSPGQTRSVPVTLRNDGNAEDRFVNSIIGAPLGWRVQVEPAVLDIPGKSQLPFFVKITAPADAERGDEFELRLTTRRAEDVLESSTRFINVEVFLIDDFDFFIQDDSIAGIAQYVTSTSSANPYVRNLRDEGADANDLPWDADNDPDNDFDTSGVFKMLLRNPGDTDDVITFNPRWGSLSGLDLGGNPACDGAGGHPDGWRVRYWQEGETPPGFANVNSNQMAAAFGRDIPLAAGEQVAMYAELKWISPTTTTCSNSAQGTADGGRGENPATEARLAVEAYSANNPVNRFTHFLTADALLDAAGARQSSQMYASAVRNVAIYHGSNSLEFDTDEVVAVDGTVADATTRVPVRIANLGNEMDTLRVSIPANIKGFQMSFVNVEDGYAFDNDVSAGHGGPGRDAGCSTTTTEGTDLVMYCTMGAGDEVYFETQIRAGSSVDIGDDIDVSVSVLSVDTLNDGQAGSSQDALPIHVDAVGRFVMDLLPNPAIGRLEYNVKPGQQLVIPVSLDNQGSTFDEYNWAFADVPNDDAWIATLSHGGDLRVPAQFTLHGFMTVFVPPTAQVGDVVSYTLAAQSNGNAGATDSLDVQIRVVAGANNVALQPIPQDIFSTYDSDRDVEYNLTKLGGVATGASVRVATPPGGSVYTRGLPNTETYNAEGYAVGGFEIGVGEELGTSRIPVQIFARTNEGELANATYVVNFASTNVGFTAEGPEDPVTVIPGGDMDVDIELLNVGLSSDIVTASVISSPAGWATSFANDIITLDPLAESKATLSVTIPDDAVRGETKQVSLLFVSESDSQVNARVDVPFIVGISELELDLREQVIYGGPREMLTTVFTVSNAGEVVDLVDLSVSAPSSIAGFVNVSLQDEQVRLEPGASVDLVLEAEVPASLAGGAQIPLNITATSNNVNLRGSATDIVTLEILPYRALDVDGDGFLEYAVDRNQNETDGFESYSDPIEAGIQSTAPSMESFLSEEGLASKTITEVVNNETITYLEYMIDGDKDGRTDIFIDSTGDFIPDIYWSPGRSNAHAHAWQIAKDLDADNIAEPFLDVDGDGLLDAAFNFATGDFTTLLRVDVDDDGHFDYVVDSNGNGIADEEEVVLLGEQGRVIGIRESKDVTGDGKLDTVIDEDGDGQPDYFIPHGSDTGIPIVLRDVTGDGVLDWTYDADGDNKRDSYYDPAKNEAGLIDTTGNFGELLKDYWYVGALFALVAVLFVVLMVVTRRS